MSTSPCSIVLGTQIYIATRMKHARTRARLPLITTTVAPRVWLDQVIGSLWQQLVQESTGSIL